ncbi:hypothetical protein QAD02_021591, partial [Eretmocerus hayati]
MNVIDLEGSALVNTPAKQNPESIDLDRSNTVDLLDQCQTDMQEAVMTFDSVSSKQKFVKIVTKTGCAPTKDGCEGPDDFENLITLHAPPTIVDQVTHKFQSSVMDDSTTGSLTTNAHLELAANVPTTYDRATKSYTSVLTTDSTLKDVSATCVATKKRRTRAAFEVPTIDAPAILLTNSESDIEGDTDDDETIATFITSTGQQLALYAVEDSDDIYAVALYDESGEPPSNFHFLMKEDVERLIGEGAVRTVKRPSSRARGDLPKPAELKNEIKLEFRGSQVDTSVISKTEREIKQEVLEISDAHTANKTVRNRSSQESVPMSMASDTIKTSNAASTFNSETVPEDAGIRDTELLRKDSRESVKPTTKDPLRQQSQRMAKARAILQLYQKLEVPVSLPEKQITEAFSALLPKSTTKVFASQEPLQGATASTALKPAQVTKGLTSSPQFGPTINSPSKSHLERTDVSINSQSVRAKEVANIPHMERKVTVTVAARSGETTRLLTAPQSKEGTKMVPTRETPPQRSVHNHVPLSETRFHSLKARNVTTISQTEMLRTTPRIFQVPKQVLQGRTHIECVQNFQPMADIVHQVKPQAIIYQAQRVQKYKGTTPLQKINRDKGTLQTSEPHRVRKIFQASKSGIIRAADKPYRHPTAADFRRAHKMESGRTNRCMPTAQIITEVPDKMMELEISDDQAPWRAQKHQHPQWQPMENIITKFYTVNTKCPSMRESRSNELVPPKDVGRKQDPSREQTDKGYSYVISKECGSYSLDDTIEEIDSDVEIIEQSTVQYILCDGTFSDTELTFDELEKSLQSFDMNRIEKKKDKENSNICRPGRTKGTVIKFSKISKAAIQITSPSEQLPPTPSTITRGPRKPRNTYNMLHRKIQEEFVDPQHVNPDKGHISSDDLPQSGPDSSSAEIPINSTKIKRSRKQKLTVVERADSEIIIQPASVFSANEKELLLHKKTRLRRKRLPINPHPSPRLTTKKIKKLQKSVEVIDLDPDDAEKDILSKNKGSSDKENNSISVRYFEGGNEASRIKNTVMKEAVPFMQCCHCMGSFKKRNLLAKHLRVCSQSSDYVQDHFGDESETQASSTEQKYPCKFCSEICDSVLGIARHVRMIHRKKGRRMKAQFAENEIASSDEGNSAVGGSTRHNLRRSVRSRRKISSPKK